MPTIVSLLSRDKFISASPVTPAWMEIRFLANTVARDIIEACRGADCLFSSATAGPLGADVLENIPDIKMIQTMGVGFDHIDIPTTVRLGIPVANMAGANATSVAEHVVGSIIAVQRRFLESDAAVKAGEYSVFRNGLLREGIREIRDSRIGLIGFGNIAQQVARVAIALGATVSYYAPHQRPPEMERQFPVFYRPLNALLATSDVVSLHMPLNEATRGLIGRRELALMSVGSILINSARGEVVDQFALAEALETGHLSGAALDTLAPEPPGPDHPLLTLSAAAAKRLLVTPHTAGVTLGSYKRMIEGAFNNMSRVLRGELPQNIINGIAVRV